MNRRESLAAALWSWDNVGYKPSSELGVLIAAARERLAQLERPEDFCPHESCPICRQIARNTV